ncbi:hypothetical protein GCM10025857_58260 [Alicyclobacillus contaminans]|uniref:Uncharacterized protein n=1 Tax=Tetragenococcus osmophilus TaxID=526944 RepID=A0AA38CW68_9ENTE|nr:hypothetical protein GCM10025857_58260 [Alicyclobacillus contaminans]GMA71681.1 hypothetical protein GCM10025885_07300 [Tetragenococcus osmophilus]
MKELSSSEVRQMFLDFFKQKGMQLNLALRLFQWMILHYYGLILA